MLDNTWVNVSLSWGTMKSEHLIDAFEIFAIETDDKELQELIDKWRESEDEEEKHWILNEDIWDYLNDIAPDGCYFGGHPGDGCDYGFWNFED